MGNILTSLARPSAPQSARRATPARPASSRSPPAPTRPTPSAPPSRRRLQSARTTALRRAPASPASSCMRRRRRPRRKFYRGCAVHAINFLPCIFTRCRNGNHQAPPTGYPHNRNHARNQESHLPGISPSATISPENLHHHPHDPLLLLRRRRRQRRRSGGGCGRGSGGGRGKRRQSPGRQELQGPDRRSCLPARSGPGLEDTTTADSGRRVERQAPSALRARQEVWLIAPTGGECRRRSREPKIRARLLSGRFQATSRARVLPAPRLRPAFFAKRARWPPALRLRPTTVFFRTV